MLLYELIVSSFCCPVTFHLTDTAQSSQSEHYVHTNGPLCWGHPETPLSTSLACDPQIPGSDPRGLRYSPCRIQRSSLYIWRWGRTAGDYFQALRLNDASPPGFKSAGPMTLPFFLTSPFLSGTIQLPPFPPLYFEAHSMLHFTDSDMGEICLRVSPNLSPNCV